MVDKTAAAMIVVMLVILIISLLGVSGVFSGGGEIPTDPAECSGKCSFNSAICGFFTTLGFPECWLQTSTFIWYAFIPVTAIWMIIFGFLDRIRIFKGSINAVLAFLIAFSTIPLGVFVLIVSFMFGIMGIYSVGLFMGLFFVGTILYSRGLIGAWRGVYGGFEQEIKKEEASLSNAMGEVAHLQKEIADCKEGKGHYSNLKSAEERERMITEKIMPRLIAAQKRVEAGKAHINFIKDRQNRVKKTFDLETKT